MSNFIGINYLQMENSFLTAFFKIILYEQIIYPEKISKRTRHMLFYIKDKCVYFIQG